MPQRSLEPREDRYWTEEDRHHQILDAVAARAVARLSFDDGNLSDIEIGLVGLLQRDLTASFLVLAGRLESPGSWARVKSLSFGRMA